MPERGGVLFVHAHPDDESMASGGTIARLVADGVRVDLVTCTDGAEGEIHDPTLDAAEARPRLAEIRAAELACSVAALGGGAVHQHLLGYRDSGMMGTDANGHPEAFWQADLAAATDRLIEIVREARPAAIVTYDENGNYGHPDHINAARIARDAFAASAGSDWAVSRFYEIAFARESWVELMGAMKERGIACPGTSTRRRRRTSRPPSVALAQVGEARVGGRGDRLRPLRGRDHDPRGRLGPPRRQAAQHGLPQDPAPGHGLAARPPGRPADGAIDTEYFVLRRLDGADVGRRPTARRGSPQAERATLSRYGIRTLGPHR